MRVVSAKSLCVLFGFLVPCLGMSTRAEAGVIPWLYNSIFGHGWGGGYGGGMHYGAGYGGGYGMGYSAPMYSAPVYAAPVMSAPVAPVDGTYNAHYGPSVGYYDYGYGYGSSYVVDSGSCCTPCSPCSACPTGDCATSIQSSKPAPIPTPAEEVVPVNPKIKRGLPPDDMVPATGTGVRGREMPGDDAMPKEEIRPARPMGGVGEPTDFVAPIEGGPQVEPDPAPGTKLNLVPTDRNITVRYVPAPQRSLVAIPRAAGRVVRVDRATREQLIRIEPKPQLASNP